MSDTRPLMPRLIRTGVTCLLTLVCGCQGAKAPARPEATAVDLEAADTVHGMRFSASMVGSASRLTLASLSVRETHDQQYLPNNDGTSYGPKASLMASPHISGFTHLKQVTAHRDAAVFVAWVALASTTVPDSYRALGLIYQLNCVFLRNTKGKQPDDDAKWEAFVTDGTTGTCTRPTAGSHQLAVVSQDEGYYDQSAFPGVARFSDDEQGRPLIGVRCLNRWCELGPRGFKARDVPRTGSTAYQRREGAIKGWHDEQMLPVERADGTLEPRIRGMVIPDANIALRDTLDYLDKYVSVAEIWLKDAPPASSPLAGKLRQGRNQLELSYDRATRTWKGHIAPISPSGNVGTWQAVNVRHMPHVDIPVPGTARFFWEPDARASVGGLRTLSRIGVWVPCDQGCCEVDM